MAESHSPTKLPHAVVFAYPYQGPATPALILAADLAAAGFTVTYVLPEFIHHRNHHNGGFLAESDFGIRCTTISDGFPLDYDFHLNCGEYWGAMVRDFPARVDSIIESIITSSGEGAAGECFVLVADALYTWPAEIAAKHNLVNVLLFTGAATVFVGINPAMAAHIPLLIVGLYFLVFISSVTGTKCRSWLSIFAAVIS